MTTMAHKHVTATVVYVDSTASGANNGTSPADALLSLPAFTSLAASTVYLIRRGTGPYTITPGTSTSKHGLGIIAMPKPTDPLYDAVPAEAKAVWDGDSADYAQINIILNATTVGFTTCNGLTLFRLDIVSQQAIAQPAVPFFTFTTVNMLTVEKCKSRINGIDLTAAVTYSAIYNKILTSWKISGSTGISVRGCLFERSWDHTSYSISSTRANGRSSLLDISASSDIYVDDIDFVYVYGGYSCASESGSAALIVDTISKESAVINNIRFKGVEVRDVSLPYRDQGWAWLCAMQATMSRGVVSNIAVTAKKIGTYATPSVQWSGCAGTGNSFSFMAISLDSRTANEPNTGMFGVDVSNISIDYTGLSATFGGLAMAASWSTERSSRYDARWSLKNFTFLAPGNQSITGPDGGSAIFGSCPVALAIGPLPAIDVDGVNSSYSNINGVACDFGLGAVNNLPATGYQQSDYYGGGINAKNVVAVGHVYTLGGFVDLDSVTIPLVTTYPAVHACAAAQVYVGVMTLPTGYASVENPVTANENAQIMINNINVVGNWSASVGAYINNHVAVANADGVAGAWRANSPYAKVQTGVVYRTGGAAAALFMQTPTAPTREMGPWLAPFPYAAKAIDPGATGRRLLRAYLAVKGFATLRRNIFASIQIHIESPFGTYPRKKMYLSASDGWMEDDLASVWNNDVGLSLYRIVIPFKVDRYENLGVRIHFMPIYENSAYYYLDPKLEIVAG